LLDDELLIGLTRNAVNDLLAEIDRLQKEVEELKEERKEAIQILNGNPQSVTSLIKFCKGFKDGHDYMQSLLAEKERMIEGVKQHVQWLDDMDEKKGFVDGESLHLFWQLIQTIAKESS
jgi:uncharacterized coiled-coil DUF342 family protein